MKDAGLRVVSVGECTLDEYVDPREFVGGISLNFAVNAKRCGADFVSLISCAGDNASTRILEKLSSEDVDGSHVSVRTGKTARQKILCRPDGERIFPPNGYQPGVLADFSLNEKDIQFIQTHNLLASACFRQVEHLFQQVMDVPFDGWRVADFLDLADFDHDPRVLERYLARLRVAFVSGNLSLSDRLKVLTRQTSCVIVMTLGASGSVAFLNGESFPQSAIPVSKAVDSTGCGDAFQAAFTVSYWKSGNMRIALQRGAEQAAKVIQHLGAID